MKAFIIAALIVVGIFYLISQFSSDEQVEDNPQVVSSEFTIATFLTSVLAGGIAGTSIDLFLFPVDAIKTRI